MAIDDSSAFICEQKFHRNVQVIAEGVVVEAPGRWLVGHHWLINTW